MVLPKYPIECQERHILVINDEQQRAVVLESATYSIGRSPFNSIIIKRDTVSRQHAQLSRIPGKAGRSHYQIIDGDFKGKSSTNGLLINGDPCYSRVLKDGDRISLGGAIEAYYLMTVMEEATFQTFLESIASGKLQKQTIHEPEALEGINLAAQVRSSLGINDPTAIMMSTSVGRRRRRDIAVARSHVPIPSR
jgi:hypothetical protein